ncbi:MAG: 23S rRNA (uracil(1939)-C(5))-methyltransferase RlmD, partial [Ruminococcus sp.]|nr:23S rRNA (uracil(1939)-C(5))-methyltransferase RlmD [Candidatus Apopatosoma intestinale]
VLRAAPTRVDPACPAFGKCGGCLFRHISYEAELALKKSWVQSHFDRIGGFSLPVSAITPSPETDGYRNKAQLPAGTDAEGHPTFGFYRTLSHRLVPCYDCLLTPPFYRTIAETVAAWARDFAVSVYDEATGKGLIRHLYIRDARATGEVMVCLVINGKEIQKSDVLVRRLLNINKCIKSIQINHNTRKTNEILGEACTVLWGSETITDRLGSLTFDISPLSFYQVNRAGAERLYTLAGEFANLSGGETVLDLYCGAGTIGLFLSDKIGKLYGAEIVPAAVENAKENARRNGVKNAEFFCADAGKAALELERRGVRPDVIIVDPPRKGISADVIDAIDRMSPERIVMISCNSATAARDCALLRERGYEPTRLEALDMFPRTGHVESVIQLSRKRASAFYLTGR